ncbi:MAG TPA: hypothetical protein PK747_02210 [Acidobacteriota bacterium]|nr:hypothetical protein [Acidobacteriota bacterium]HNT16861.1 hypothetical protein [Acidobacteriota bacterium]HQO19618.1 hypothetical protein [Acidobacteriota bacterium]HQQ46207.1 hypothetical protein [Acidobacteriota bacterium]
MPMDRARFLFFSAFVLFGTLFLFADFLFFQRIFWNLYSLKNVPANMMIAMSAKLMGLVFLTTFTMLVFSSAVTSLSYLYLDEDLELLFALPLQRDGIRALKLLQAFFNASAMVVLLIVPVIMSYQNVRGGGGLAGSLFSLACLVLFVASPSALGASLTIILARCFPARRLHQFLTVLGLALLTSLILLFRLSKPEVLINPKSSAAIDDLISSIALPAEGSLPSSWFARAIVSSGEGDTVRCLVYAGKLSLLAAGSLVLLALLVRLFHSSGFARSAVAGPAKVRSARGEGSFLMAALRKLPLGKEARAVLFRDAKAFFRSPAEWGQLFILGALVIIYLFNVRYVPLEAAPFRVAVTLLNFVTLLFVVSSVAARFAFTSLGWEGRAFFTTRALPVPPEKIVLAKFLFTAVPLSLFSLATFYSAGRLIDLGGWPFAYFLVCTLVSSVFLTAMALYMGCRAPMFDEKNPARMLVTPGGFMYMFFSMIYVAALTVISARPVYRHYLGILGGEAGTAHWFRAMAEAALVSLPAVIFYRLSIRKIASLQQK